jgi:molybdopterin molybdotransferase
MVDSCSEPSLTPFETALEQLLAQVKTTTKTQMVPIEQACDRVLAKAVISELNIPSADNSAMDGYAVRASEAFSGACLKQVAKVFAGHPFDGKLGINECARIMTGGQIPAGADAVIMQENASATNDQIQILQTVKQGDHVRCAGEDIKIGQEVLTPGRRLTPADIGLLASLGCSEVSVFEQLTVAVISTGDELKSPGSQLEAGQFYESNGYTVSSVLERFGVKLVNFGIIQDDLEALRTAFSQADDVADLVITSGGVSVGEADYTKTVLEELGRIDFWKLAIKPGKPFAFGHLPNSYFMGLPGNPVSALVTLHQLGVPMFRKISGEIPKPPMRLPAIADTKMGKRPGRTDFQRGYYYVEQDGRLLVKPTGAQGSGILTSMSQANCYVILEQERGPVSEGETVTIEPFDAIIS